MVKLKEMGGAAILRYVGFIIVIGIITFDYLEKNHFV